MLNSLLPQEEEEQEGCSGVPLQLPQASAGSDDDRHHG